MSANQSRADAISEAERTLAQACSQLSDVWKHDNIELHHGSHRTDESEEANEFMEQISALLGQLHDLCSIMNKMEDDAMKLAEYYKGYDLLNVNTSEYFSEMIDSAQQKIESLRAQAEEVESAFQRLIANGRIDKSFGQNYQSFTDYNEYLDVAERALRDYQSALSRTGKITL